VSIYDVILSYSFVILILVAVAILVSWKLVVVIGVIWVLAFIYLLHKSPRKKITVTK